MELQTPARCGGSGTWANWLAGVLLLAYLASAATVGQFPFIDEIAYKCAGLHWANSGRYAAPELTGLLVVDPPVEVVWAGYPPLYTFAFGLIVKGFGFGWRTCVLFDAVIRVALACVTFLLARRLSPSLSQAGAWLAGLAVIPLGHSGRPDELATCFGLAGVLLLLRAPHSLSRTGAAGLLLGLSAATSPACGVTLGIVQAVLLLGADPWRRSVGLLALWAALAASAALLVFAPLLLVHPGALHQFLAHARRVPSPDFLGGLLAGFQFCWAVARCRLLAMLGLAALGLLALTRAGLPLARTWLGGWAGLLFLFLFSSYRFTYFWFVGPLFLAAGLATLSLAWEGWRPWRRRAFVGLLGLAILVGALPWLRNTYVLHTLASSQALGPNVREVTSRVPTGSVVLTDLYWWVLADDCRVYDLNFGTPPSLEQVDYVVLSGNGSQVPGQPSFRSDWQEYVRQHFDVVYDNLNREPSRLFGVRLSASAYGFGPLILARRPGSDSLP